MTAPITIPVKLGPRTLWKLGEMAEARNIRIADYLEELATAVSRTGASDPIAERWAKGLPDRVIAAELGMTNLAVATHRRGLGLPANHVPRGQQIERRTA